MERSVVNWVTRANGNADAVTAVTVKSSLTQMRNTIETLWHAVPRRAFLQDGLFAFANTRLATRKQLGPDEVILPPQITAGKTNTFCYVLCC